MATLSVPKTYKMYVNGTFIRSESGRTTELRDPSGTLLGNIPLASRKDFRNAVVSARAGLAKWAGATAYLRGQILYRAAEMLDARATEFQKLLISKHLKNAASDAKEAVEELIHYAGWTDKYSAIFSSVNPVASPHFNFSVLEPMGVVAIIASATFGLRDILRSFVPVLVGGNTAIVIFPAVNAPVALTLSEVLHHSDFPAGAVAFLSADIGELLEPVAGHLDVNAIAAYGLETEQIKKLETLGAENVKRIRHATAAPVPSPYAIVDFQETKTTWHPVEVSFAGTTTY